MSNFETFTSLCTAASTAGGPTFHPVGDDLAVYRDEGACAWFVVDASDLRAFIELGDGDDDAYSNWCASSSGVECPPALLAAAGLL